MGEIKQRFGDLSLDHVRALAKVVVLERNAVAVINKVYANAPWGLACLCCHAVKNKIQSISKSATYPWIAFVSECGMAYTVTVDGVPLRIQPDVDEIREVQLGERQLMRARQESFVRDESAILRLEVGQRPGLPVDTVLLYLFNEQSGVTLDCEPMYSSKPDAGDHGGPGTVRHLARPPQDVDISGLFNFNIDNDVKKKDGDK